MADLGVVTARLLEPDASNDELDSAANELLELYAQAVGEMANAPDLETPHGVALGPASASAATALGSRTASLLRGLRQAIDDQRGVVGDRPVHLVYGGCGPCAALALPMTTLFSPSELQVTLLEVQPESVAAAKRCVGELGLGGWVREIACVDATTWTTDDPVDIVLVECAQQGLEREPHVALVAHLAGQLVDTGVIVPERVVVKLELANLPSEFGLVPRTDDYDGPLPAPGHRQLLGTLIDLDVASARALQGEVGEVVGRTEVTIPVDMPTGHQVVLVTDIVVYGEEVIAPYASGQTFPRVVVDLEPWPNSRWAFSLTLGTAPVWTFDPLE